MSALLPKPEAIVFDFDGTIADTRSLIVSCFRKTFAALSITAPQERLIAATIGLPLETAFARLTGLGGIESLAAADRYREIFRSLDLPEVEPIAGMDALVRRLAAAGVPLAVASSRDHDTLDPMLSSLGLFDLFATVIDSDDAGREKPEPDMLFLAAERLAVPPGRLVMIGDTSFDIEMGHNAGAWTIGVTWGNHSREEIEAAKPTIIVTEADQIASAVGLPTARR
ncbi:MAG: HAD family hydrolase [Spirochaetaceae bacterium]